MIVQQAANVLDLLEYFATVKKPANLAEISASLGWPRSSTFNLLTTLAQRGFLYEPRPRAGYYPSRRWMSLVQGIAETEQLPEALCEAVEQLALETGETVSIAAPARTCAVYLYVALSPSVIRYSADVGYQVPLHASASGRALLSQFSPNERASVLKKCKYEKFAPRSLLTAEQVQAEIVHAEARGWHENIEGFAPDMIGVALPLKVSDRVLAVAVGGPAHRMRHRIPEIAATLQRLLERYRVPSEAMETVR